MSIVTAYKCDRTGKLFGTEAQYNRHVERVEKKLAAKAAERAKKAAFAARVREFEKLSTWELKAGWIKDNYRLIISNMSKRDRRSNAGRIESVEFIGMELSTGDLEYWSKGEYHHEKVPVYRGKIELRWKTYPDHQATAFIEALGLRTRGGGGVMRSNYGVDAYVAQHQNVLWRDIQEHVAELREHIGQPARLRAQDIQDILSVRAEIGRHQQHLLRRKLRYELSGCTDDRDVISRLFPDYEAYLYTPRPQIGLGLAPNAELQARLADERILELKGSNGLLCRSMEDAIWLKLKGAVPGTTRIFENQTSTSTLP